MHRPDPPMIRERRPLPTADGNGRPHAREADTPAAPSPSVPLRHLDTLWFQVAGTICNLRCGHCFISCAPDNHAFEFLSLASVRKHLEESVSWGVKEYYFTGGEPFMHRDLPAMLEAALGLGPATVLTNATLLRDGVLGRLARATADSIYSLEIRVSIDGPDAERNDPLRGEGTFDRAMDGVRSLLRHGFLPIITATQVWDPADDESVRRRFTEQLRAIGYRRPRIKILPSLRIGRERWRAGGYGEAERVTATMLEGYDEGQLLCSSGRIVTSAGVHVCPILIDSPDSLLGPDLESAARPFPVRHHACHTCWMHGAICTNYGGIGMDGS